MNINFILSTDKRFKSEIFRQKKPNIIRMYLFNRTPNRYYSSRMLQAIDAYLCYRYKMKWNSIVKSDDDGN